MATIKEHIWDKHECKCSYCKHQVGKLVDEALRLLLGKLIDPEVIARYGKTQQERMVITTYVRTFAELVKKQEGIE